MRVQNHREKMRWAAGNFCPYFYYIWENYLTIIPQARMGYWLSGHKGDRNNCFI